MKVIQNNYLSIFLNLFFLSCIINVFSQNETKNNLDINFNTETILSNKLLKGSERSGLEADSRLTKLNYTNITGDNLGYVELNFAKEKYFSVERSHLLFQNINNNRGTSFSHFEEIKQKSRNENLYSNYRMNYSSKSGIYLGMGIPILLLYNIDNYSDISFKSPREYTFGATYALPVTTLVCLQADFDISLIKTTSSFVLQEYESILEYHEININSLFNDFVLSLNYGRFFGTWKFALQAGVIVKYQIKNMSEHSIRQEFSYGGQITKIRGVDIKPVHFGYKTGIGIDYFFPNENALSLNFEFYSVYGNNSKIDTRAIRLIYFYKL